MSPNQISANAATGAWLPRPEELAEIEQASPDPRG
jgi:hypothetical protein